MISMKMMKKNLLLAVSFFVLATLFFVLREWNSNTGNTQNNDENEVKLINALEFDKLAKDEKTFVVDVHIPEQEHIPGTDAFIPYNEITNYSDRLPQDKNTPVLVYCRSGSMSREASLELQKMGYKTIYDLAGGINAYREANVRVVISPETFDLGTVIYGDVAETEFTLTNFTPKKLILTRTSTSCGCTSASVEKTSLEPYESTIVKVSFDPAVHKDDTDLGDITRTIYVNTDNPNFPTLEATITATVIKK